MHKHLTHKPELHCTTCTDGVRMYICKYERKYVQWEVLQWHKQQVTSSPLHTTLLSVSTTGWYHNHLAGMSILWLCYWAQFRLHFTKKILFLVVQPEAHYRHLWTVCNLCPSLLSTKSISIKNITVNIPTTLKWHPSNVWLWTVFSEDFQSSKATGRIKWQTWTAVSPSRSKQCKTHEPWCAHMRQSLVHASRTTQADQSSCAHLLLHHE